MARIYLPFCGLRPNDMLEIRGTFLNTLTIRFTAIMQIRISATHGACHDSEGDQTEIRPECASLP